MSRIEGMTDLCDYRCQQSTIPVLNMIQASLYQTEFHNKLQSRPITADPKGVRSRDLPSTLKARQNSARRSSDVSHPTGRQLDDQNHQNLIERLVCRLPKELQTSIIEIVSMMAASKKRMKIFAERQNIELHEMKAAYLTANAELSTSTHKCEVYRELLSKLEKKYCEGYIDSEDDKTNKNYALNSILISDGGRSSYQDKKDHEDVVIDSRFDDEAATRDIKWYSPRKNLVGGASEKLPTSSSVKLATSLNIQIPSIRKWDRFGTLIGQPTTREKQISPLTSIVDKQEIKKLKFAKELNLDGESMRNTLLIITREKYRLTKKVEVLGNRVESLKQSLQHSELQCRHLQINLAEFTGDDKNNDFSFNLQATNSLIPKKKYFGPRDDVFRVSSFFETFLSFYHIWIIVICKLNRHKFC